jgi:hypothetical protein
MCVVRTADEIGPTVAGMNDKLALLLAEGDTYKQAGRTKLPAAVLLYYTFPLLYYAFPLLY